ncbi:hypothetical protein EYF80_020415 [Liparis tanakae]|uniref:Uncharacterized protein n=1 Tax=Liparis tanakae TaxID=230148 RepID=A0A4Z2HWN0_9TELE|nr:hypothetical protein EYF80_020415 [Liparis tanakae]
MRSRVTPCMKRDSPPPQRATPGHKGSGGDIPLFNHSYLGALLAPEDVAGAARSASDQAAKAGGLLAVVNQLGHLVGAALEQHGACQGVPDNPLFQDSDAAHPRRRHAQKHRLIVGGGARVSPGPGSRTPFRGLADLSHHPGQHGHGGQLVDGQRADQQGEGFGGQVAEEARCGRDGHKRRVRVILGAGLAALPGPEGTSLLGFTSK